MKTIKQMIRQPWKTITGILIVGLAVAVLCVCVGQSFAAMATQERLDQIFATLALPTAAYTKGADDWIHYFAMDHPEIVKAIGNPGLAAAYIPELTPNSFWANISAAEAILNDNYKLTHDGLETEYTSAMFEITLTDIGEPSTRHLYTEGGDYRSVDSPEAGISINITGTVENALGIAGIYPDYTGYKATCHLKLPSMEALEELNLTVGQRYLVYSTHIFDNDRTLRAGLMDQYPEQAGELKQLFDPEKLEIIEENLYSENPQLHDIVGIYHFDGADWYMLRSFYEWFQELSISICDQSAMPIYEWQLDPNGNPEVKILNQRCYPDKDGTNITLTSEEYYQRYTYPTIVHLEGTAEEFLSSEAGAIWQEALYNIDINSQSFPIIGVDGLSLIAEFAQNKASIVEGRDFTTQELSRGEKVCIISQTLAHENNLSIGDTLSMQLFDNDPGVPYQVNISEGPGSAKPVPYFYFDRTMELEEDEGFTVIGIYEQFALWEDVDRNLYAFSPNIIFVPKAAVSVQMDYSHTAFFRTLVLQNGMLDQFQQAAAEAGFADMFYYTDNGYSAVEDSMETYQSAVRRALLVGIGVYTVIMLLFFLLFPTGQMATVRIMDNLGTSRSIQRGHLMTYCAGILFPGTVVGTIASLLLWDNVTSRLVTDASIAMEIQMNAPVIVSVSVLQLAAMMMLSLLVTLLMTGKVNLMRRR